MQFLPLLPRIKSAVAIGLAGGAVGQVMSLWGGSLSRFLPEPTALVPAAMAGAAFAGFVLADAFGYRGKRGAFLAVLAWPLATAFGAANGALLVAVVQSANVVGGAAPLGWLAVTDGIGTSPQVAAVWLILGLAVHMFARAERARVT